MVVGSEGARLACEDDTGRIVELAAGFIAELSTARGGRELAGSLDPLREEDLLRACIAGSDLSVLVVGTYGDALVGLALVEHPSKASLHGAPGDRIGVVRVLYVEPAMRGVGVGEAIVAEVLRLEAARGATALDVPALPGDGATKSFLEDMGFSARLLVMHRPLEPRPRP